MSSAVFRCRLKNRNGSGILEKMNLKELISRKNLLIFLLTIGLAGGVLYRFKGQFVVAMVDGQPISRLALIKELEKQYGKNTLDVLVTQALVWQEAEKQGVTVSSEEVDQEIKRFEEQVAAQGQDLNQVLSAQGMTRDELKEQIKLQKTAEKIVGKDIQVTDEEVATYFTENEASSSADTMTEDQKQNIRQQLEQQKLSEGINQWLKSLHDSAKITYF